MSQRWLAVSGDQWSIQVAGYRVRPNVRGILFLIGVSIGIAITYFIGVFFERLVSTTTTHVPWYILIPGRTVTGAMFLLAILLAGVVLVVAFVTVAQLFITVEEVDER